MADIFAAPDVSGLGLYQGLWNGLTFGEGTDWHLDALEGLLAYDSRSSDAALPQADGEMSAGRWAAGRIVTLPFLIFDRTGVNQQAWLDSFDVLDPYEQSWLAFRDIIGTHLMRARVVRRNLERSSVGARAGAIPAVVELKLVDPRIYDGDEGLQTAFIPFGAGSGGGFDLPADLPLDMAAATPSSVIVSNTGNTVAWPLIRVNNPSGAGSNLTSITIENLTSGDSVQVDTTVVEGQTLVIDMDAMARAEPGPHIHIDGASRYGDWVPPRDLLGLRPGLNEMVADFTGGAPIVRLDWLQATL